MKSACVHEGNLGVCRECFMELYNKNEKENLVIGHQFQSPQKGLYILFAKWLMFIVNLTYEFAI